MILPWKASKGPKFTDTVRVDTTEYEYYLEVLFYMFYARKAR